MDDVGDYLEERKERPTSANAQLALFIHKRDKSSTYEPLALQVLTMSGPLISEITDFVDPSLVRFFDVPNQIAD